MADSDRQEDNLFIFAAEQGATQGSIDFDYAPSADPDDNHDNETFADLNQAPLADLGHHNNYPAVADFNQTLLVDADHHGYLNLNHHPPVTANPGTQDHAVFVEQEYLPPTGPGFSQTTLAFPDMDLYRNLVPNSPTLGYDPFQAGLHGAPSPPHHPPTEPPILSHSPALPLLTLSTHLHGEPSSTNPHGEPSSFGAVRSMRVSSRFTPTQPRSRSCASCSEPGSATTATTAYSFVAIGGSEGEFITALSSASGAIDRWRKMMNEAPENSTWRAVIKELDTKADVYISLCVTRDFLNGSFPDRGKITLHIRNLLNSLDVIRQVSLLGTLKYTDLDDTDVLEPWHSERPSIIGLSAEHILKRIWVAKNPYVICLGEAANEAYFQRIGDTIRRLRDLSNRMILSIRNTLSVPLECRSADFSYIHIYGEGDALDITALFGTGNTNRLIDYYGHASFRDLMADIIEPHMPFIAYVAQDNYTQMLTTMMTIPAAMVCFYFYSPCRWHLIPEPSDRRRHPLQSFRP